VPLVIDGGDLEHGLESTVLDVRGAVPVLLRPGALPLETLESACGCSIALASAHGSVRSPGMKYRHYSPRAELWLYPVPVDGRSAAARLAGDAQRLASAGRRVAALAREPVDVERFIARPNDPRDFARGLFGWLREFDELGVDVILVEGVAGAGIGRAVMDRLTRAATRLRTGGSEPAGKRGELW
jgi:L-threonylcarbamoyladenylate synthase